MRHRLDILSIIGVVVIAGGVWLGMMYSKVLERWEYKTLDWRYGVRGELECKGKVVYVDIDSESVEFMGERPIPRAYFGKAIEGLIKYGNAAVVGVDMVFSKVAHSRLVDEGKVEEDNRVFREVIKEVGSKLVLGGAYTPKDGDEGGFPYIYLKGGGRDPEMPGEELRGGGDGVIGLINTADGYSGGTEIRWVPMFGDGAGGKRYLTMGLELYRIYKGIGEEGVRREGDRLIVKGKDGEVEGEVPLVLGQLMEVNWFTKWGSEKDLHCSLKTVVMAAEAMASGDEGLKHEAEAFYREFKGSVVLVGPVDPLLQDLGSTPVDEVEVPKVSVHGNVFKTVLEGKYLSRLDFGMEGCIVVVLGVVIGVGGLIGMVWQVPLWLVLIGWMMVIGMYIGGGVVVFNKVGLVLPMVGPVGNMVMSGLGCLIYRLVKVERQRGRIKGLFGAYLAPELVDRMVEQGDEPRLGGAKEEITAFFSDVEGFSLLAEKLEPEELTDLMNSYLTEVTGIIQEGKGTLDKYIGDAVVAMFGAPLALEDHEVEACRVGVRILLMQRDLWSRWSRDGRRWSKVSYGMRTRVGINTGMAVVGNMGSQKRFNYTMMGDDVNLAARCESAGKEYGVYMMVAEGTRDLVVQKTDEFIFRLLDKIIVKGKTKPVRVYELVGFKGEVPDKVKECVGLYEMGMEAYFNQEWEKAEGLFKRSEALEEMYPYGKNEVGRTPSVVMRERVEWMKGNLGEGEWDGVFRMQVK